MDFLVRLWSSLQNLFKHTSPVVNAESIAVNTAAKVEVTGVETAAKVEPVEDVVEAAIKKPTAKKPTAKKPSDKKAPAKKMPSLKVEK